MVSPDTTTRLICCIPIKATMVLDGTTSSICQYNIWLWVSSTITIGRITNNRVWYYCKQCEIRLTFFEAKNISKISLQLVVSHPNPWFLFTSKAVIMFTSVVVLYDVMSRGIWIFIFSWNRSRTHWFSICSWQNTMLYSVNPFWSWTSNKFLPIIFLKISLILI